MSRKQIIDGLLKQHFGLDIEDTSLEDAEPAPGEEPYEEVNVYYDKHDLDRIDGPGMYPPFQPLTLADQQAVIEGWKVKEK